MVGIMASSREKVASMLDSAKFATDIPTVLHHLHRLKDVLAQSDAVLLSEFLPHILQFHSHRFTPVCKLIAQILGDVGTKHLEFAPDIVPVLLTVSKDGTPAVARQAISCGIDLFRSTLIKVAIQGLYKSELENSLESSWAWAQTFRDEIYAVAFEPRSDGTRLLALKFVEAHILLYTPDPCGASEPPSYEASKGMLEFNASWLRGGHPILNAGDLLTEARQSLGLLLDQLRVPTIKSLSNSMIIVLIKSLSAIARKRPSFYGHILPVLLGLDMSSSVKKGVYGLGVYHALKNAFLSCLECQHSGAAPWRDRLVGALREMKAEGLAEQTLPRIGQVNGSLERKDDSQITQEGKPLIGGDHIVQSNAGKKRSGLSDASEKDSPSKRSRSMHVSVKSEQDSSGVQDSKQATTGTDRDSGHVQQLIAMFGAIIAQGEKAIGSLEILISSISSDLLADVVMANMRNLPLNPPQAEVEDESLLNKGSFPNIVGVNTQLDQLSSILSEMLPLSHTPMMMDSVSDTQRSASNDTEIMEEEEQSVASADHDVPCTAVDKDEKPLVQIPFPPSDEVESVKDDVFSVLPPGYVESGIPGLDSAGHGDGSPKIREESSQEQISNLSKSHLELAYSTSIERSEELSPKASVTDASSITSSAITSVPFSAPVVLPRMSAPVIKLAKDEKDQMQKVAFARIVEAYKHIVVAGGSHLHSTLLSCLAVEFPLELDPWKMLQKHILADYVNHEGHELTIGVLFRLFREAEEERDFFASTTATSVYEKFFLTVAESLRDSFPASDKSLSKLLNEAPYLPKSLFKLLDGLCSPSSGEDEELPIGDRVTQGLSAVWSLILLRPPIRDACLRIAMQSAVHHLEEVRMKAIRLVANKLFPLSSISLQIEDFAKEMLYSVNNQDKAIGRLDSDRSDLHMDGDNLSVAQQSGVGIAKMQSSDTSQSCTSQNLSSPLTEAKRCMSLYFALCTKKHSLLRELFLVYKSASDTVKQAINHQIPILVRTMGSSSELLEILSDPPCGSDNLLIQVLHTLSERTTPSPELVGTIRMLFDSKIKDVEVLIPILSYLPKDEVLLIFPHLVNLPLDKFQAALSRLLQGSSLADHLLSPAEVLIAIHGIDPERDGIPLKKVIESCNTCFEQRHIFTQQVLAKVLNQLVEQIPLPLLFMRTVLQAIGAFPALVDFILEILSRLVNKQIWKYPKLWVGFLKCALLTKPQSFRVLLQLPPAQLENALHRTAALKDPLIAHASQPNIQSSLPRSVLAVLGIATDSKNLIQATTPAHMEDTGNSDKEVVTEKSKESSTGS